MTILWKQDNPHKGLTPVIHHLLRSFLTACCKEIIVFLTACRKEAKAGIPLPPAYWPLPFWKHDFYLAALPQAKTINIPGDMCTGHSCPICEVRIPGSRSLIPLFAGTAPTFPLTDGCTDGRTDGRTDGSHQSSASL